jgi:hypothetical protein
VLPSCCEWSPWQGEQSGFFGSTFKEPCNAIIQHPINYEAVIHHPTLAGKEATPSSNKMVPSDDAARCVQDSVRGDNKQRKHQPLGTAATSSNDDDHGREAGCSSMGRITAATRGGRRLTRMPFDHFKRLLEEAC